MTAPLPVWVVGEITGEFAFKGDLLKMQMAGWVKGPFGLDFRVFWSDDLDEFREPGWILTHLDSGLIVRGMHGSLAAAQAFADRLALAADWKIEDPKGPKKELGKIVRAVMDEFPDIHFTVAPRLGPLA